jgi:hypothetical protein
MTAFWIFLALALGIPGLFALLAVTADNEEARGWMGFFALAIGGMSFIFFGALALIAAPPGNMLTRFLRAVALLVFAVYCLILAYNLIPLIDDDGGPGLSPMGIMILLMAPLGLFALYTGVRDLTIVFFTVRGGFGLPTE